MIKNADTKFGSLSWIEIVADSIESPSSRIGHSLIYFEGNLYLFGGKDEYSASSELWQYHVGASVWTKLSFSGRKPPRRFYHSSVLYDRKMFVFGGSLDSSFSLWVFDFNIFEWELYECDDSWPCNRHSQSLVLLNDNVYMYGGYTYLGTESDELWAYDLEDNTWVHIRATTASGQKPSPMFGHSAVSNGSVMWIFGGSFQREILSELWSFDTELKQWKHVVRSTCPPSLYYHIAIVTGEVMLTYGGLDENIKCYRGMWKLNFETEEWTQMVSSELPPLAGHAVAVSYIKSTENGESKNKPVFSKTLSTEINNKLLNIAAAKAASDPDKILYSDNNLSDFIRRNNLETTVVIPGERDNNHSTRGAESFVSQKMVPVTPGDIELRPLTNRSTRSADSQFSLPGMVLDETQQEEEEELITSPQQATSPKHMEDASFRDNSPKHIEDASSPPTPQRVYQSVYENRNVSEQEAYCLADPDIVFSDLESSPGFCVNNPLYNDSIESDISNNIRDDQSVKTITFYDNQVLGDPKLDHSDSGSQGSRSSLKKKKHYKRGFNTEFYIVGHGQEALPKSVVLYRCKIG